MDGSSIWHSLQRATGQIRFTTSQNRLGCLYQSGSAKLLLPKSYGNMREAVIINTAGGLTGGDEFRHSFTTKKSELVITSQAAERIYESSSGSVKVDIYLNAREASVLHWLPQETIFFNKSRLNRKIQLEMSADSECLMCEPIVFGRVAMGETITECNISDNWRIYRGGRLVHAESMRVQGDVKKILNAPSGGRGARMMATILYLGARAEQLGEVIREAARRCSSSYAVSCWDEKLVVRLLTDHVATGRSDMIALLNQVRQQRMPRMWPV